MMNLRHIEVFHAVYTNGSISAAARALNVAQPSISKVLRHAESRVGFALFHRTGGRVTPTDEARALFVEVDEIYSKVGSLRQSCVNIARGMNGIVRLAVMPGFGLDVAPKAIAQFRRQYPSVNVDVQTIHHSDIPKSLCERSCDIAIAYDPVADPRLDRTQVGAGELVLLVRGEDEPDGDATIDLSVLERMSFISLINSGPLGDIFNRAVDRLELNISGPVTVNTMYIAAALVRQGLGVALVDEFTARACQGTDLRLRRVEPPLPFNVYCVFAAERPLSAHARALMRILDELMLASATA